MKPLFALIIALIIVSACKEPAIPPTTNCDIDFADSTASHPKAAVYQDIANRYAKKGLPGITLYIRDNNGVCIVAAGKADIEKNVKMSPCVVSKVASITKMFVGTLAHMLVEEGVLNYDDPASKYLSGDIVAKVANANCATVRSLMNHTTGIYDITEDTKFYLEVLNNPDQTWSSEELIKFAYGKDALFACGNKASYSNTNTLLLGLIITKATGTPHAQLVKERIIDKLGLKHTYYYSNVSLPSNIAQGYYDLYNNGTIANVTNYNTGSGNGYGGIYGTVSDMAKFADALFRDKTLLTQASMDEMLTFTEEDTSVFLGLGAMRRFGYKGPNRFGYGHTGRDLGYSADLFYFPNQNTTLSFIVNYGTNASTALKQVFLDFESEVLDEIGK